MNEPKRRGRPPKAKEEPLVLVTTDVVMSKDSAAVTVQAMAAQAYALRVWSGQSPDVPRNERLRRVKLALEGQGLSMEGVVL